MNFDVVIPSRGSIPNLKRILTCISEQTVKPDSCIVVINGHWVHFEHLKQEITAHLPDAFSKTIIWKEIPREEYLLENASYARNLGCTLASSQFVYFLDDDNFFDSKFLWRSIQEYDTFTNTCQDKILYSPIIMWRDTDRIQSRGIKAFHFSLWWPEPVVFGGRKNIVVKIFRPFFPAAPFYREAEYFTRAAAIGGNSLFAERNTFEKFPFDEDMWFVFEDLDFAYRVTRSGMPLYVSKSNRIYHMEREKTELEKSFLANPKSSYQKAKNRVLFVRKNASWFKKFLFVCLAFPVTSIMTMAFIILHGGTQRWSTLQGYWQGMRKWWSIKLDKPKKKKQVSI